MGRINTDIPFGIVGMSGGPIFGLADLPSGQPGYAVAASQSYWYKPSRVIVGCPIRVFGELLSRYAAGLPLPTV